MTDSSDRPSRRSSGRRTATDAARRLGRTAANDWRLVAVVVLAAALRLYGLDAESLWTDELITVDFVIRLTPLELLVAIPASQPHLPLYYVLLDLWASVAGTSAAALRLPAAAFGTAAVAVTYRLGERLYDRNAGLVAALVLAVSSFHVQHSQEVRMYSLLTLLAAASTLAFYRVRTTRTWRSGVGYAVVTLCLVATHPLAVFVPLGQAAYLAVDRLLWRRAGVDDEEHRMSDVLRGPFRASLAATWLVAGPVLLVLLWKLHGTSFEYIPPLSLRGTANTVATVVGFEGLSTVPVGTGLLLVGGLATLAAVPAFVDWRAGERRALGPTALLAACVLAPILATIAVSYALMPVFWPRYVIAFAPPLFVLVGRGTTVLASEARWPVAVAVLLVLLALLTVPLVELHTTTEREQWRAAGNTIDRRAQAGDVVLVADAISAHGPEYYVDRERVVIREVVVEDSGTGRSPDSNAEIARLAGGEDRVWVAVSHASAAEERRVVGVVSEDRKLVRKWEFVKVNLYLYERPDGAAGATATELRGEAGSRAPPRLVPAGVGS